MTDVEKINNQNVNEEANKVVNALAQLHGADVGIGLHLEILQGIADNLSGMDEDEELLLQILQQRQNLERVRKVMDDDVSEYIDENPGKDVPRVNLIINKYAFKRIDAMLVRVDEYRKQYDVLKDALTNT